MKPYYPGKGELRNELGATFLHVSVCSSSKNQKKEENDLL